MDPLGARSQFVEVQNLPTWDQSQGVQDEVDGENQLTEEDDQLTNQLNSLESPFLFRQDINSKIVLFNGDVALLNCTAIISTSNETLTDKNPVSDSIHRYAGPELRDELLKLKGCRTGEAKMTEGFNLAARFIIHTVGPKYKAKYRTAAESSLYSCYRNIMQLAKEHAMASVGLCVVSTVKRAYPLEDATHIALRTVRRFLENHGENIETVVFAVSDVEEPVYRKLMPLYYPCSKKEEKISLPLLPADIGNTEGEPVVPERQIRIAEKPGNLEDDSADDSLEYIYIYIYIHIHSSVLQDEFIKQDEAEISNVFLQICCMVRGLCTFCSGCEKTSFHNIVLSQCNFFLSFSGVDLCGRTVMVVVGRNIPVTIIDMEKALLYFIHVMDHITVKEYVMVYFHTLTGEHNHLDTDFLKKLSDIVDAKFKKNLRAFYFVHPTFRTKVSTWFFTTFSVSGLKEKVHHIENLQQLFTCILPEQIDIPPFVLEYDTRVNSLYYTAQSSGL
ncbi:ganglioside-induced differentiation-associated protein 2-like [Sinocyclocheilus rhinocerous]|uniref:ganglioside-induced differentiation-associated protein 2-like n=1 Tax=Sinocyclocheilus rhinocerous TaxID=307959 RepID=UPI0007B7DED9|nr:PREDICTED: ganglioside-induced differentiation-associated protein 2-like [Sinocyclocheilus rhinocerous]